MFWLIPVIVGAIAGLLFSFWNKLPNEVKLKIIEAIISAFIDLFKKFYQFYKNRKNTNDYCPFAYF